MYSSTRSTPCSEEQLLRPHHPGDMFSIPLSSAGVSVAGISALSDHTCARSSGGGLWCWGSNDYGKLGINSTDEFSLSPGTVSLGAGD
jgi:alpha-tubulin suppressor-like RCC1 family protein